MTIFNTESDTAAKAADRSKKLLGIVFQSFVMAYKKEFDAFWRNPQYTPSQMAEAWDIEGVRLFTNSEATRQYINTIDPNILPSDYQQPPVAWQPEMDNGEPTGRVIIG